MTHEAFRQLLPGRVRAGVRAGDFVGVTMDETQFAGLTELLADAETCGRLSNWEEGFLSDMRDRVTQYGDRTQVSDKQWDVLKRIEQKVYAT